MTVSQKEVARWFDQTYETLGKSYLRPIDAYPIFLQFLNVQENHRLLDVACGAGLLLQAARMRQLRPVGVDLSGSGLALAREGDPELSLSQANSEQLPFLDNTFDYITCLGSIERFFNRDNALGEMRRVAKPEAKFCFMVRNAEAPGWRVWRQWLGRQNHRGHQDALSLDNWKATFETTRVSHRKRLH